MEKTRRLGRDDFYSQMADVFADPLLYHDLTTPAGEEENGAEQLSLVLDAQAPLCVERAVMDIAQL